MRIFGHLRPQLQIFARRRRNHDGQLFLFRVRGSREKIDLSLRVRAQLPHLHHQTVGIRLQADGKVRFAFRLQHHTRHTRDRLRHPNPRQQRIADVDGFAFNFGSERGIVQIKINAIGRGQAMGLILHLIFQVEHNRAGIGGRPMPDPGDAWQLRRFLRRVALPGSGAEFVCASRVVLDEVDRR